MFCHCPHKRNKQYDRVILWREIVRKLSVIQCGVFFHAYIFLSEHYKWWQLLPWQEFQSRKIFLCYIFFVQLSIVSIVKKKYCTFIVCFTIHLLSFLTTTNVLMMFIYYTWKIRKKVLITEYKFAVLLKTVSKVRFISFCCLSDWSILSL